MPPSSPSRRVQLAAARALVDLDPRCPFPGSSQVVPILSRFVSTQAAPRAVVIDGNPAGPRAHAVFTPFANAGGLPGINIPCTPSAAGLPIGFQLVGPYGSDVRLLDMAEKYAASAAPWQWPDL